MRVLRASSLVLNNCRARRHLSFCTSSYQESAGEPVQGGPCSLSRPSCSVLNPQPSCRSPLVSAPSECTSLAYRSPPPLPPLNPSLRGAAHARRPRFPHRPSHPMASPCPLNTFFASIPPTRPAPPRPPPAGTSRSSTTRPPGCRRVPGRRGIRTRN